MKRVQTERPGEFGDAKRDLMMKQVSEDAPGKAGLFRKVYSGKASPRQAMKAFCLQCCWMDGDGMSSVRLPALPDIEAKGG